MSETELHREHKELVMALGELRSDIKTVDGKVDTAVALLQNQAERQDRADARVDRLELELDRVRDENRKEVTKLERKHSEQLAKVNWRLATGVGLATALAFLLPIIVTVLIKMAGF